MTQLFHSIRQTDRYGREDSELVLTVDYDEETRTAYFKKAEVINLFTYDLTNITHILAEHFDEALDSMMDQVDWDLEYYETMQLRKEYQYEQ